MPDRYYKTMRQLERLKYDGDLTPLGLSALKKIGNRRLWPFRTPLTTGIFVSADVSYRVCGIRSPATKRRKASEYF